MLWLQHKLCVTEDSLSWAKSRRVAAVLRAVWLRLAPLSLWVAQLVWQEVVSAPGRLLLVWPIHGTSPTALNRFTHSQMYRDVSFFWFVFCPDWFSKELERVWTNESPPKMLNSMERLCSDESLYSVSIWKYKQNTRLWLYMPDNV